MLFFNVLNLDMVQFNLSIIFVDEVLGKIYRDVFVDSSSVKILNLFQFGIFY